MTALLRKSNCVVCNAVLASNRSTVPHKILFEWPWKERACCGQPLASACIHSGLAENWPSGTRYSSSHSLPAARLRLPLNCANCRHLTHTSETPPSSSTGKLRIWRMSGCLWLHSKRYCHTTPSISLSTRQEVQVLMQQVPVSNLKKRLSSLFWVDFLTIIFPALWHLLDSCCWNPQCIFCNS